MDVPITAHTLSTYNPSHVQKVDTTSLYARKISHAHHTQSRVSGADEQVETSSTPTRSHRSGLRQAQHLRDRMEEMGLLKRYQEGRSNYLQLTADGQQLHDKVGQEKRGITMELGGLHHITAITGNASLNVAFYTEILGLHLVKKTVNQDDVSAYHLF